MTAERIRARARGHEVAVPQVYADVILLGQRALALGHDAVPVDERPHYPALLKIFNAPLEDLLLEEPPDVRLLEVPKVQRYVRVHNKVLSRAHIMLIRKV